MPLFRSREAELGGAYTRSREEAPDGTDETRRDQGGRRTTGGKWILIPLILFMLITPLSPTKDFHNNGLVLPPRRGKVEQRWCTRAL